MYDTSARNTLIPPFLRIVTFVECIVVGATATVLFFFPAIGQAAWAWSAPPFNSRYVGAIYFAALLPLLVLALAGRWSPGRVVLWMILAFTASIGLAMFLHVPQFDWSRPSTYAFWFLYIFLPINSVVFLYKLRGWEVADADETSPGMRILLLAIIVLSGLYGVGLLLAPETVTAFWPWKIDAFHGRIYAATFLTPAVGAFIILRRSSPSERLVLGLTLATLGVLSVVGTVFTSLGVPPERQVNYANLGTWAFFAMNLLCAVAGLGLVASSRK